jgi:hypothetical protein
MQSEAMFSTCRKLSWINSDCSINIREKLF